MIDEMRKRAGLVADEHDELQAAKADKHKAQVEFLRAVVDAVRPALPALCSRVQKVPGPIVRALNVGHCLYLGESGGWIESCEGGALLLSRDDEHVAEHFIVEDIADAISIALTSHAGTREWTTSEVRREAERLRAAVLLLRGT